MQSETELYVYPVWYAWAKVCNVWYTWYRSV